LIKGVVVSHYGNMEKFVCQLTECQGRMYAYIFTLLGNADRAHEVLQSTNLTIWRKADEFKQGTNFGAWASRIAYYEVLADRKRRNCDRHLFDVALIEQVAVQAESTASDVDDKRRALRSCMEKLDEADRELIKQRYEPQGSVQQIAQHLSKSVGAISQALYRIRRVLAGCIAQTLASERAS